MKEHGMTPDTEKEREEIMNELTRTMYAELENADQGGESSDPGEKAEDSSDKQEMESFLDFLSRMASGEEDGEDDDDEEENDDDGFVFGDDEQPEREMDADDYHNRAVDYAREHRFAKAVQICEEGLFTYPDNVDLLADAVKYCAENGEKPRAQKHYEKLCAIIPRSRFNWRAFTFSLDYLMLDAEENESECRSLLEDYAKALPFEEKRFVAASELETALGNHERSMEILLEAVNTLKNASQCSLRLADLQLERGEFEEAVRTADYGIIASAQVQPSINIPYLYLVRTLAADALLRQRKDGSDKDEIDALRETYKKLLDVFPVLRPYRRTIANRIKLLDLFELTVE